MPAPIFNAEMMIEVLHLRKNQTRRPKSSKANHEFAILENDTTEEYLKNPNYCYHCPTDSPVKKIVLVTVKAGQLRRHTQYELGKTYAIIPGRGNKSAGRVLITGLDYDLLYNISKKEVAAERFGHSPDDFCRRFNHMYGQPFDLNPLVRVISFKLVEVNQRGLDIIQPTNPDFDFLEFYSTNNVEVV